MRSRRSHFDLWTRANVGESWLYPVTPLTWSHILLTFNEATRYRCAASTNRTSMTSNG